MMQDQKHIGLAIGAFFGVVLVGSLLLVWPTRSATKELRVEIAGLEAKMEAMDRVTEHTRLLGEELQQAQDYVNQDLKRIPGSPDIADLMRRLSLRVDGITVWDQTFTAGSQHPALEVSGQDDKKQEEIWTKAMPLNIDMQATFESVFAVMQAAESMDRLVRIMSVRLNIDQERLNQHQEPIVTATVGLDAIFESAEGDGR